MLRLHKVCYLARAAEAEVTVNKLSMKLIETEIQLTQSRSLYTMRVQQQQAPPALNPKEVGTTGMMQDVHSGYPPRTGNEGASHVKVTSGEEDDTQYCIFEMIKNGSCKRKTRNKCRFSHDIPDIMKEAQRVREYAEKVSYKIGRCASDMVANICPDGEECRHKQKGNCGLNDFAGVECFRGTYQGIRLVNGHSFHEG